MEEYFTKLDFPEIRWNKGISLILNHHFGVFGHVMVFDQIHQSNHRQRKTVREKMPMFKFVLRLRGKLRPVCTLYLRNPKNNYTKIRGDEVPTSGGARLGQPNPNDSQRCKWKTCGRIKAGLCKGLAGQCGLQSAQSDLRWKSKRLSRNRNQWVSLQPGSRDQVGKRNQQKQRNKANERFTWYIQMICYQAQLLPETLQHCTAGWWLYHGFSKRETVKSSKCRKIWKLNSSSAGWTKSPPPPKKNRSPLGVTIPKLSLREKFSSMEDCHLAY